MRPASTKMAFTWGNLHVDAYGRQARCKNALLLLVADLAGTLRRESTPSPAV